MALYPTKTRLALLQAVADEQVYWDPSVMGYPAESRTKGPNARVVTARMNELQQAGWVAAGRPEGPSYLSRRWWRITDAGRAVLDGAS